MLVRVGALVIGFVIATILVGALNDVFPWFWLPVLFGIAVASVVWSQPWLKDAKLAGPFWASFASGTALTFCYSTTPVTTRFGSAIPKLSLAIGTAVFLLSFVLFIGRGLLPSKTKSIAGWLLIPIAAGMIVGYVSGGLGGSNHMVKWFIAMFHLSQDQAENIVHIVRKSIHVSAYGMVGLSLFKGAMGGRTAKSRALGFAMLITLCLASFDEMRQTSAPNRTGSPWDVALDMSGSFAFVFLAALVTRSAPKKPRVT